MQVIVKPSVLKGKIEAINSKSVAHRALMMAAIADRATTFSFNEFSKDILVTIESLKRLGTGISVVQDKVVVKPSGKKKTSAKLDLVESGSTLRFMTAFATLLSEEVQFMGKKRLAERPIRELVEQLEKNGISFSSHQLPFTAYGTIRKGQFTFSGDVSSQYISAVLMASAKNSFETTITLTSPLESKAYVDITIDVMKKFGVLVEKKKQAYLVKPSKIISPGNFVVEGDWSNSAFFLTAGALQEEIELENLNLQSVQGDRKILQILKNFGAKVEGTKIRHDQTSSMRLDISQIPDLVPILAVLCCSRKEKSYLINGKRLRLKESDRLVSTCEMIQNLGGFAEIHGDDLCVGGPLEGGTVDSFNDHRIVMAASIASVLTKNDVVIQGAEAVNKSYPSFFEDFERLGGHYVRTTD